MRASPRLITSLTLFIASPFAAGSFSHSHRDTHRAPPQSSHEIGADLTSSPLSFPPPAVYLSRTRSMSTAVAINRSITRRDFAREHRNRLAPRRRRARHCRRHHCRRSFLAPRGRPVGAIAPPRDRSSAPLLNIRIDALCGHSVIIIVARITARDNHSLLSAACN